MRLITNPDWKLFRPTDLEICPPRFIGHHGRAATKADIAILPHFV